MSIPNKQRKPCTKAILYLFGMYQRLIKIQYDELSSTLYRICTIVQALQVPYTATEKGIVIPDKFSD